MSDVRPLTPMDAPVCRDAFRVMLAESFDEFPPAARAAYLDEWTVERFAERSGDVRRVMLGAFQDVWPLGLLLGSAPESGVGTVVWLWVSTAARGRGVGAALLEACFLAYAARGCHKVRLFTSDQRNHAFYERHGMVREGFHPSHWWRVDFWSMGRVL